jgi:hypothetical protein
MVVGAWLLAAAMATAQDIGSEDESSAAQDPGSTLPNDPAKGLVLVLCDKCHGLEWIERSGGSEEGWKSRLRRMNRAGAMLSPEQVALLTVYLAKALPERPAPPQPLKRHQRQR